MAGWFDNDTIDDAPVTGWWAEITTVVTPAPALLSIIGGTPIIDMSKLLTPGAASLTITGGTPTVTVTQQRLVTPNGLLLEIIGSHPAVGLTLRPGGAPLTITGGQPPVVVSDHQRIVPVVAELAVTGGQPGVALTAHQFVQPTAAPLTVAGGQPVVTPSDHKIVTPAPAVLTLTGGVPAATVGITVVPAAAALTLTGSTPVVSTPAVVAPTAAALTIVGSHPALGTTLRPDGAALTITGGIPNATVSDNQRLIPTAAPMTITGGTPVVTVTNHQRVTPGGATLVITAAAPTVTATANRVVQATAAALTITGGTPTVTVVAPTPPFDSANNGQRVNNSSSATAISYSQTTIGSNTNLFVAVVNNTSAATQAKCDGVAMTEVAQVPLNNSSINGWLRIFRATGLAAGVHAITAGAVSGFMNVSALSVAYTGVGSIGTPVTTYGNGTALSQSGTVSANQRQVSFFGHRTTGINRNLQSPTGGTNRAIHDVPATSTSACASDSTSNETFGVTATISSEWGGILLPLNS